MSIDVSYDLVLNVAYIRTMDRPVARTCELTEEVLVDLDEFGVLVGIELLSMQAELPLTDLRDRFHVPADVLTVLNLLRPSVGFHLTFNHEHEGVSRADKSLLSTTP